MRLFETPYTKHLNNNYMLRELPFYDELNIAKTSKKFKGHARIYNFAVMDSKDLSS